MPKAYSYLRFSTSEQAKGDSQRRQLALAREYASRHDLELDEKLTFQDLGVSAFRGLNAETGRLGEFLEAVRDGVVATGSYLLVENLDRISRQSVRKAMRALERIVEAGITVVTLNDGKAYTAESIDDDPMSLLLATLIFLRSNEESATKSRRLKAAWQNKRATAASSPLTSRGPAWLELTADRTWKVREDRAAVVRRIFSMAAEGTGEHAITAALNKDGVVPFGNGSRPAKHWHRTSIIKILENPAVGGVLQPFTHDHVEGRTVRTRQAPIEGHFPIIVDHETRQAVQALRSGAVNPQRGRHAAGRVQNMLGGLARCPICANTMTRVTKGSSSKAGRPNLVCTKAKAGGGCRYRAVRLDQVEDALVRDAKFICQMPSTDPRVLPGWFSVEKIRSQIQATEIKIRNLVEAIEGGAQSPSLTIALANQEKLLEFMRGRESEVLKMHEFADNATTSRKLDELRRLLQSEDVDRHDVNLLLRQLVSEVVVQYGTGLLVVRWKAGGESILRFGDGDDPSKAPSEWQDVAMRLAAELPPLATPMTESARTAVMKHPVTRERVFRKAIGVQATGPG